MKKYVRIEPGKEFPIENVNIPFEGIKFYNAPDMPSIHLYLRSITKDELLDFKGDMFNCYLFETNNIPFLVIKYGRSTFDCSINFISTDGIKTDWSPINMIGCYLVDGDSNILKAMRHFTISENVINELKTIRDAQWKNYQNPCDVVSKVDEVYRRYSTNEMIQYGKRIFNAKYSIHIDFKDSLII